MNATNQTATARVIEVDYGQRQVWTPESLQHRLEWAALTEMRMHVSSVFREGYKSGWPAILGDVVETQGWRRLLGTPSARDIADADEVNGWVNDLIDSPVDRRIIRARALLHPQNGSNLISWRVLAAQLDRADSSLQERHNNALKRLCAKINCETR